MASVLFNSQSSPSISHPRVVDVFLQLDIWELSDNGIHPAIMGYLIDTYRVQLEMYFADTPHLLEGHLKTFEIETSFLQDFTLRAEKGFKKEIDGRKHVISAKQYVKNVFITLYRMQIYNQGDVTFQQVLDKIKKALLEKIVADEKPSQNTFHFQHSLFLVEMFCIQDCGKWLACYFEHQPKHDMLHYRCSLPSVAANRFALVDTDFELIKSPC